MENIEERFKNVTRSRTFRNIVGAFKLDKKAVFDIGCSFGEHVACFGPGSIGVTITKEEADYGKEKGLNIIYGNIEANDFKGPSARFDVIFANNLFEHLFSPHTFLSKIKKYLKPNGILILGVPCIPKIVSLTRLEKFRGSLAVAHINFFTKDTLTKTVERAGWSVEAVRSFHARSSVLDKLLDIIAPHFYVIAHPDLDFEYHEKRMKELAGYESVPLD